MQSLLKNELNGKQLETDESNGSDEEGASELEIEERLAGGTRRSTQPKDVDAAHSYRKLNG